MDTVDIQYASLCLQDSQRLLLSTFDDNLRLRGTLCSLAELRLEGGKGGRGLTLRELWAQRSSCSAGQPRRAPLREATSLCERDSLSKEEHAERAPPRLDNRLDDTTASRTPEPDSNAW